MLCFRSYIANRVTDKLTRITDKIYCCRSGSSADTQAIADIVAYELSVHQYVVCYVVSSPGVVFEILLRSTLIEEGGLS